jgi:hypothetical protein
MMRLEGLGKLESLVDLIGSGTRELSANSVAPQPSALPQEKRN